MRAGFVPAPLAFLRAAPLAFAASACFLVAACSPGADYPSIFPAVHDMPPPRTDTTMDQLQVQKATEDLITQRNHLNAEAPPSAEPAKTATNPAATDTTASASVNQTNSTTRPTAKKKAAAHKPTPQQAGAAPPATTASAQTAGAEPKP
jgi:hypothetical protein